MADLRPNEQRAKNTVTLLWIMLGLDAAALLSGYLQYDLLGRLAQGELFSDDALDRNDVREQIIGAVYLIAYIITGVVFIQWFRRAYYNLHQRVTGLNDSEGWAAGGWFVPIMNLFKPYQIMRELYTRTSVLLGRQQVPHTPPDLRILGWWWALWVLSSVLGQITMRAGLRADTVDELMFSTLANMASSAIGIPLALLAIRVVKGYVAMEPLLAHGPSEMDLVFPPAPQQEPPA